MTENSVDVDTDYSESNDNLLGKKVGRPKGKTGKPPTLRLRHSNYLLTFNTNKPIDNPNSEEFRQFDEAVNNIINSIINKTRLGTPEDLIRITKAGHTFDKIVSIRFQGASEIGDIKKCLHYHIAVKIAHRTAVHLNLDKIRAEWTDGLQALRLKNGVFNYELYKDAERDVLRYIYKHARDRKNLEAARARGIPSFFKRI